MKILKSDQFKPFDVFCQHCDAHLEVDTVEDIWKYGDGSFYIRCPVCEEHIDIETNSLSKLVRLQVTRHCSAARSGAV